MKIERAVVQWQRAEPLLTAIGRFQARTSLLLRLHGEDGSVGLGEASPLPGYSPDTIEQADGGLARLDPKAVGELLSAQSWDTAAFGLDLPASARFALEMALLDLLSGRRRLPAWRMLAEDTARPNAPRAQPLSRLIDGRDPDTIVGAAVRASSAHRRTIKLKIHPDALASQIEGLELVRQQLPALRIRLDANRALRLDQAQYLFERIRGLGVEYIEEPLADVEQLSALGNTVPIALDESLQQLGDPRLLGHVISAANVRVLVVKPMALGGIGRARELHRQARALGLSVVFSHLIDGPVAFAATAALSLALGDGQRAAGLDEPPRSPAWPCRAPEMGETLIGWTSPGLGLTSRAA